MSVSVCAFCITDLDIILSAKLIRYCRKKTNWGRGGWGWRGGKNILFWNPSGIFRFFYCISGNCMQSKAPPFKIMQLFVTSFGNFRAKTQDLWKFRMIFSWPSPKNSTLFLINSCKFHMLFLWYPWKLYILNLNSLVFSGVS